MSEPASAGSDDQPAAAMAPIASALRIVSGAAGAAIVSSDDLAAVRLDQLERRLERVLVVRVDDRRRRRPIEPPVRPEALRARRRDPEPA